MSRAGVVLAVTLILMLWLVIFHAPLVYGTSFRIAVGPRIFMGGIDAGWPPGFAYEDVWIEGRVWGLDNRIGLLSSFEVLHLHNMTLPSYTTYQLGITLQRLWEDDAALRVEVKTLNMLHYPDCGHWWGVLTTTTLSISLMSVSPRGGLSGNTILVQRTFGPINSRRWLVVFLAGSHGLRVRSTLVGF